jgi:cellulose synthase/poly-beta-1,6-N-acetylglucosamine synthase-like glycosyltransferase
MSPTESSATVAVHVVAWGALAILCYVYFGYPLLLLLLTKLRPFHSGNQGGERPATTVIVAAWNEEDVIADKIENTLNQDYAADRLDLVVVSDGSTDRTDEIVQRYAGKTRRVRLLHTRGREGKSVALNIGAAAVSSDILVMTDANAMFQRDAVRRLVEALGDPAVGAVSGELRYREGAGTESTEGVYWRYEQIVKRSESGLGSLLGANGSIYALRRELFRPVLPRDVNDFRIPYEVLLQGRAVVLQPRAVSYEAAAPGLWAEYRRKVRIMSRAIPTMLSLVPRTIARGRILALWQLISHKLLREIQGVFFAGMLLGAGWGTLKGDVLLAAFLAVQLALCLLGALAWAVPTLARIRPARLAAHFDMIVLASLVSLLLWATGRVKPTWQPARGSGQGG